MGIEINAIKLLFNSKSNGLNFDKTLTLGRQGLHIKKEILASIIKKSGLKISKNQLENIYKDGYADNLFKALGANLVQSIDYSNYEQASIIHDMNFPVPESLKEIFDLVFDGGTLEHVFNFPTAIKNSMEMVKVDGYFISVTVSNNFSGHGFYQFSPELFFRIFSKENGFQLEKIWIIEGKRWFKVLDPVAIHQRVTFINNKQTYLAVVAKKIKKRNIFEKIPLQSDYVEIWDSQKPKKSRYKFLPLKIKNFLRIIFQKFSRTFKKSMFEKEMM